MQATSSLEAGSAVADSARATSPKNPWLAVALAVLFGPFGMLYVRRFWASLAIQIPMSFTLWAASRSGDLLTLVVGFLLALGYTLALAVWAYGCAKNPTEGHIRILLKRELGGYFATPVAYVFISIFLLLCSGLTFYVGNFYEERQATLGPAFFEMHPILYIVLIPAISMRLWAEERKQGTIELLMTLPVTLGELVLSKFLAAWLFTGIALALSFPLWITVNYLGDPDNGVIVASYLASWLMGGAYLAMGACVSSITKNQVIAFVVSVVLCVAWFFLGLPSVVEGLRSIGLPSGLVSLLSSFSFHTHFQAIARGVIDLRDMIFFISLIGCFLFINAIVIELKKAD